MIQVMFLGTVFATFFNAALVCFFAKTIHQHGLISNPLKGMKALWPVTRAIFIGFIPAVIMAGLFAHIFPAWKQLHIAIIVLGTLVSALLLYRSLLASVGRHEKWNCAIIILMLIQFLIFYFPR